jgi:hypothetical protein
MTKLEAYLDFLRQYWNLFGPIPQRHPLRGRAADYRRILL